MPGFYIHLEPGAVFYGGGVWMPDPRTLGLIRDSIATRTKAWEKAKTDPKVTAAFDGLSDGDPLTRPPRGYDAEHPAIEDIKKRSFFLMKQSRPSAAAKAGFVDEVAETFAAATPVLEFLTTAVGERF